MLYTAQEQSDVNFFFLSKKTRRGRKSNFQLPQGPRCTICLEFKEFSSEPIEKCSKCNSLFHYSCYTSLLNSSNSNKTTLRNLKSSNFICCKCSYANKQNRIIETVKCGICSMSNGILEQQHSHNDSGNDNDNESGLFYHSFCKRLIPELVEESNTCLRKWRYKNSCHFCKAKLSRDQPVIKCLNSKCKEFYHIPCAIEKGMLFSIWFQADFYNKKNQESIPFYCSCHNKRLVTCYKEHMYEFNRKSTRYSSDSHNDNDESHNYNDNDTIEETEKKKESEKEDYCTSDQPKEFLIDFSLNHNTKDNDESQFPINKDNFYNYFSNEPSEEFNVGDNDDLLTFFKLDLFKEGENTNNLSFIN